MERTLYVETNFPVGIAKGQDLAAAGYLSNDATDIQLAIPSVCFMEAFSVWEREEKQTNKLAETLAFHLREAKRNLTSACAKRLLKHLEEARLESEYLLYEVRLKLNDVLLRLSGDAAFININQEITDDAISHKYVPDPTDNLILCSILWHARQNPGGPKAFLSSNHNDFGQPDVCDMLLSAGVKYFRATEAALGWIRAQDMA